MKLNPVLEKELNLNSRSIKSSWLLLAFNAILAVVAGVIIYQSYNAYKYYGVLDYSVMSQLYIVLAYIEFIMILLIVPISTAGAIAGEKERKTLDILLSTQLKPYQIILGKVQTSLFMVFILSVSSMPIFGLTFMFGGISFWDIFVLIFLLTLESILFASFGIFFSTVFKKTTLATAMTYISFLFMIIGSYGVTKLLYYIMEQQNIGQSTPVDIKNMIAILLVNPAVTFSGLISNQAGNKREILNICSKFGEYGNSYLVNHWIAISITIQMIIAIILFILATRNINPYRTHIFKSKKN